MEKAIYICFIFSDIIITNHHFFHKHNRAQNRFSSIPQAELEADIFNLYDVDNSGHIEFTEFLLIVSVMSDGTAKTKLQQIFRIFDSDKNGFISLEELNTIVNHLFHLVPESHRQKETTPEKVF